jgi:hypothetical protein
VRTANRVVAATVGDLHCRHDAPRCRAEPDFYEVMAAQFKRLDAVLKAHNHPPLYYAGDIFHRWNSPPELINFLISHLPFGYAVAGNHDLPYHNYDNIKKSAYWTLVQAGKLSNLPPGKPKLVEGSGIFITGWPFGHEPEPVRPKGAGTHVALIHAYCWQDGHAFPGVREEDHAREWAKRLRNYDGLVFGDNHRAFDWEWGNDLPWVRNGGCFVRQTTAEMDVQPTVGLIWNDGTLTSEPLDCTGDKFHPADPTRPDDDPAGADFGELMAKLAAVGKKREDFRAAAKRAADHPDLGPGERKLILQYLGEG